MTSGEESVIDSVLAATKLDWGIIEKQSRNMGAAPTVVMNHLFESIAGQVVLAFDLRITSVHVWVVKSIPVSRMATTLPQPEH
jgi:hypothetical protein